MIRSWQMCSANERFVHILMYFSGTVLSPIGTILMVHSHFGASGCDALYFAIQQHTGIPVTFIIYMFAALYLTVATLIRKKVPNLFSIVTILIKGAFTGIWDEILMPIQGTTAVSSALLFFAGIILLAFFAAPYFMSLFPSVPADDMVRAMTEKGVQVWIAKMIFEGATSVGAIFLHGEVNIGTVITIAVLGPLIGICQKPYIHFLHKAHVHTANELLYEIEHHAPAHA